MIITSVKQGKVKGQGDFGVKSRVKMKNQWSIFLTPIASASTE